MNRKIGFVFLSIGHFYDHFFMLIFATVSALALAREWRMEYAELILYATPGFVAFGVCTLLAGWLADHWSRRGMMLVFFIGLGVSSILTSLADSPLLMSCGLLLIGVFASIYHPVGLALVIEDRDKTGMPLAINGVFGNLGVASAVLITGYLIDHAGWRAAFVWPGILCVATGMVYGGFTLLLHKKSTRQNQQPSPKTSSTTYVLSKPVLIRAFGVVLLSTALGGLVFQSTTFALPKVLHERLAELAGSASLVGQYAFYVFALAATGQLIVGYLVDRYSVRIVFAAASALQAISFALMVGLEGWAALLVAMVFMLGVFGQIPVNDVIIGRITSSDWRSRVYALRYIVTFSIMASSIPLIAWIQGTWGFDRLFVLLSATAGCIFITVLALPKSVSTR